MDREKAIIAIEVLLDALGEDRTRKGNIHDGKVFGLRKYQKSWQ